MKKNYREIEFIVACDIDSAVKELKECKDLVCGKFNGKMLYSDIDDVDSAYKKITGKIKSEFDEYLKKQKEKQEAEDKKHKESIPQLTKEWIEKGNFILDKEHYELWAKIVPIRLGDLYKGFELGACLDIVELLNNNCDLEQAKELIQEQGHSGMSFDLVCSMIKEFCSRGAEFVNYARL